MNIQDAIDILRQEVISPGEDEATQHALQFLELEFGDINALRLVKSRVKQGRLKSSHVAALLDKIQVDNQFERPSLNTGLIKEVMAAKRRATIGLVISVVALAVAGSCLLLVLV